MRERGPDRERYFVTVSAVRSHSAKSCGWKDGRSLGHFLALQRLRRPGRVSWVQSELSGGQITACGLVGVGHRGRLVAGIASSLAVSFNQVRLPVMHQSVDCDGGQRDVNVEGVTPGPEPTTRDHHDWFSVKGNDDWDTQPTPHSSTARSPSSPMREKSVLHVHGRSS
jgi:hypothetical protein